MALRHLEPGSHVYARAVVAAQIGACALPALLPGYIGRWDFSKTEAGWLVGIFFAGYVVETRATEMHFVRRDARAENVEAGRFHLAIMRDLKRVNARLSATAYSVREGRGELLQPPQAECRVA
jgi:hypothetical protein